MTTPTLTNDLFSMQNVLSINLLNTFRTGNQIIDIILGLVIVGSLKYICQWLGVICQFMINCLKNILWDDSKGKFYTLVVDSRYECMTDKNIYTNNMLTNAIINYIIDHYRDKINNMGIVLGDLSSNKTTV